MPLSPLSAIVSKGISFMVVGRTEPSVQANLFAGGEAGSNLSPKVIRQAESDHARRETAGASDQHERFLSIPAQGAQRNDDGGAGLRQRHFSGGGQIGKHARILAVDVDLDGDATDEIAPPPAGGGSGCDHA